MAEGEAKFCRVLNPVDPWMGDGSEEDRVERFSGGSRTSVADQERCRPLTVVACFYGCSKRLEPPRPAYMDFSYREVTENGGTLEKSDADPPWPPEYNDAHHEIVAGEALVARYIARAFAADQTRMNTIDRRELFVEVCRLLALPDAHQKLRVSAGWRLRKLFSQERALWDDLARSFPLLREDKEISKALRAEATKR